MMEVETEVTGIKTGHMVEAEKEVMGVKTGPKVGTELTEMGGAGKGEKNERREGGVGAEAGIEREERRAHIESDLVSEFSK